MNIILHVHGYLLGLYETAVVIIMLLGLCEMMVAVWPGGGGGGGGGEGEGVSDWHC